MVGSGWGYGELVREARAGGFYGGGRRESEGVEGGGSHGF